MLRPAAVSACVRAWGRGDSYAAGAEGGEKREAEGRREAVDRGTNKATVAIDAPR